MQDQGSEWGKCVWLCTDRAVSMVSFHSGAVGSVVEWLKCRAHDYMVSV